MTENFHPGKIGFSSIISIPLGKAHWCLVLLHSEKLSYVCNTSQNRKAHPYFLHVVIFFYGLPVTGTQVWILFKCMFGAPGV
jgi:hypothetical protein